jgi:hypothetical protein
MRVLESLVFVRPADLDCKMHLQLSSGTASTVIALSPVERVRSEGAAESKLEIETTVAFVRAKVPFSSVSSVALVSSSLNLYRSSS